MLLFCVTVWFMGTMEGDASVFIVGGGGGGGGGGEREKEGEGRKGGE